MIKKLLSTHRRSDVAAGLLLLSVSVGLCASFGAHAAIDDWAEGADGKAGATRIYFNSAAALAWKNPMGDWCDARGVPQGDAPYATTQIDRTSLNQFVEWDVTALVREWMGGVHPNQGFFLRQLSGGGNMQFASRGAAETSQRPQLVLTSAKGSVTLTPEANTFLETSTVRSMGDLEYLRISARPNHALLRFNLSGAAVGNGAPLKAVLRLFNIQQTSGATGAIGVFRCAQDPYVPDEMPTFGLAARYPGDRGINRDPAVVFFTDFESPNWKAEWSRGGNEEALQTVAADPQRKFAPLQGRALSAKLPQGGNTALNLLWKFKQKTGSEPDEMYFRYYIRLGEDWNQTVDGGKLPGFSGTYNRVGWGGRKADGIRGWSARGSFMLTVPQGNPLAGLQPIGTYCYHADMKGAYGDAWMWSKEYRGLLAKNRWYCIEQYVKLNRPDGNDGVIRAWVDGRPAFEKTGLRFRLAPTLHIEQLWMNIYHGGTSVSPYDQHVFIDNVVIARSYIGPMK